jgi:hypothetical protein
MPDLHHRAEQSQPFQACISDAAQRGRFLMSRLIEQARKSMPLRADQATNRHERDLQHDALRLLLKHRNALEEAFPHALLECIGQLVDGGQGARSSGDLSFGALELMGDEQMQERVEMVRAQQAAADQVEASLGELNSLICAAQGLRSVQADRNPLRPEVYVRSLRKVAGEMDVPTPVRVRWMQHFGESLGGELGAVYRELSSLLREHGVTAASFTVTQTTYKGSVPGAGRNSPGGPVKSPVSNANKGMLTLNRLRKLLAGELDEDSGSFDVQFARQFESEPRDEPPADFSPTLPNAWEALQAMNKVDAVVDRISRRQTDVPAQVSESPERAELRRAARNPGQALALEVVSVMMENIKNDARLLPSVRKLVTELEMPLLRLALVDPRFFSDKVHPGRALLEAVTERSLAWTSEASDGFKVFYKAAHRAVGIVRDTRASGAAPFAFAMESLDEVLREQQRREKRKREKAVKALLQAEQRNLLAEKITKDLKLRAETSGVPRGIVYFVAGPWSQVIAQARLSDVSGKPDPCGYEAAVTDLLWSCIPEAAAANPARLTRMIPGLLDTLREGLNSIGFSRSKSQRFFDELMALHARATKLVPGADKLSPRERLEAEFREGDSRLWLAPSEAAQSGFLETQAPTSVAPPLFEATQQDFSETMVEEPAHPMVAQAAEAAPTLNLQPGAWTEIYMDDRWVRTQLTWASPHGTLFMFTSADGVPHSMTRQSLDHLAAAGHLRLLADQAVVAGALDAVAQTALRNTLDVNL